MGTDRDDDDDRQVEGRIGWRPGTTAGPAVDEGEESGLVVRHRAHRFPGRRREVKALFDDTELAAVRAAAGMAGLTPSGFVASAALAHATTSPADAMGRLQAAAGAALGLDRALLAELLEARLGVRRYAVNVNQAVVVLHAQGGAPVWLRQAVAGCDRAVARLDEVTLRLAQLLGRPR